MSIFLDERKYPDQLFKVENGVCIELKYKWSGRPYLGHYYAEYEDANGNRVKVMFFADYSILTPNVFKTDNVR